MNSQIEMIKSGGLKRYSDGEWLTPTFMLTAGLISLAISVIGISWLFTTANGNLDAFGRPLGTDFASFWTAGRLALEGRSTDVYNWAAHFQEQKLVFGPHTHFFSFAYPPPFLLLTTALATLPYLTALIVWQFSTLAAATWFANRLVPDRLTVLLAVGCPATLLNLLHGQNAFLTAFLLGSGLWLLDRKPWLSGLLFGCLIYKPHLGLILPVVLIVGRHWRAFFGAAVSAIALILLSVVVLGPSVWQAFFSSTELARHVLIEQGGPGWDKIQTVFAAVRMWGGSVVLAYVVQALVAVSAIAICAWLVWAKVQPNVRNAAICACALLVTPFALDYDLLIVELGIAFLIAEGIQRGFWAWEKTTLGLLWVAPALARGVALVFSLPLGLACSVALYWLALRRGRDRAEVS